MITLVAPSQIKRSQVAAEVARELRMDRVLVESKRGQRELEREIDIPISIYSEHEEKRVPTEILEELESGKHIGVLSDGGAPCVGDPGWKLVREAHLRGVNVSTHGVNSFVLSAVLMSGCSANQFRFLGYPPVKERNHFYKVTLFQKPRMAQVLMEPPYRSQQLIVDLIGQMKPKSWLSFSSEIGTARQNTLAGDLKYWRSRKGQLKRILGKKPLGIAVFDPGAER